MSKLGARQLDVLTHIGQVITENRAFVMGPSVWESDPCGSPIPRATIESLLKAGFIKSGEPCDGYVRWTLTSAGAAAVEASS